MYTDTEQILRSTNAGSEGIFVCMKLRCGPCLQEDYTLQGARKKIDLSKSAYIQQ